MIDARNGLMGFGKYLLLKINFWPKEKRLRSTPSLVIQHTLFH